MDKKFDPDKWLKSMGAESGVVIILDALGMADRWENEYPKNILRDWEAFMKIAEKEVRKEGRHHGIKIRYQVFSDTVIITATAKSLFKLILEIPIAIRKFIIIGMTMGFYFRGCMSKGVFFPSKSKKLIIGPAINEAVSYYNKMNMVGVIINPSLGEIIYDWSNKFEKFRENANLQFIQYDIPMNDNTISKQHWIIKYNPETDITKMGLSVKKSGTTTLREFVKKQVESNEESKIREKWENMLAFFDYIK